MFNPSNGISEFIAPDLRNDSSKYHCTVVLKDKESISSIPFVAKYSSSIASLCCADMESILMHCKFGSTKLRRRRRLHLHQPSKHGLCPTQAKDGTSSIITIWKRDVSLLTQEIDSAVFYDSASIEILSRIPCTDNNIMAPSIDKTSNYPSYTIY